VWALTAHCRNIAVLARAANPPPESRSRGPLPPQGPLKADHARAPGPSRHPPCVLSDISGWSLSLVGLVPRAAPTCNDTSRLLADVTDFLFSECRIGAPAPS
jgi:hypothetical protein